MKVEIFEAAPGSAGWGYNFTEKINNFLEGKKVVSIFSSGVGKFLVVTVIYEDV